MNTGDARDPRWLDGTDDPAQQRLRQALNEAERWTPSDLRARRVWTRLEDAGRLRPPRRGALALAFGLGAALACAAMALVFTGRGPLLQAPPITAVAPPALPGPELLQAPAQGLARTLPGGAMLQLEAGATVALERPVPAAPAGRPPRPEVRAGRVHFTVPPQPPGTRFAVRAAAYEVVVVGTAFVVAVDHAGASDQGDSVGVEVDHGVVEVWSAGSRLARLSAGQSWHTPAAAVAPPAEPATPVEPPAERPHARGPGAAASAGPVTAALDEARLARGRDPRRAADLLARLARGDGPVAENALYELGAIYREDLGQPRKALSTWERYRTRFPRGLLRAEADVSLVETLAALGERERALTEALAFLDHHRDSERLGDIARVAGDLQRARGDCRAALPLYGRVAGARASAANRDDARFFAASCLIDLGEAGGAAALAAYLREHAGGRHAAEAQRLLEAARAARPR